MNIAISAFVISFLVAALLGMPVIRFLKKLKFGQKILEDGPTWHMNKQYTPTMGGILFIAALLAGLLVTVPPLVAKGQYQALLMFAFAGICGLIGVVDDFTKIKKKQNQGLTPMQKLLLQIAAAALFVTVLRHLGVVSGDVYVPFVNLNLEVSWWVYLPCAVFIIVGAVNAVNLTDGIDGLAATVTSVVCIFFGAVFLLLKDSGALAFCAGLLGGLVGFLIYNKNPARVFMGDTGSLFLGGAVCGMAFVCDMPLLLAPVGIVYIAEALSDILQVGYYKLTHGKRIFKMAPLHHHYEMCGWSEKKIVFIFSMVTAVMSALTYWALQSRLF